MAVLTYAEGIILAQERAGVYVSSGTDAPVDSSALLRYANEALADVWEASGGRSKIVDSATAWTSAQTATGVVTGLLTDVNEITHVWASTTSGSTGTSTGDNELDRVELSYIKALRSSSSGMTTYLRPKLYAVTRVIESDQTSANNNLLRLDYWPGVTGFYFPVEYVAQFTPMDGGTSDVPPLNDIESRDMWLLAASRIAQVVGNAHLVPGIMADLSARTQAFMERKLSALVDAKQDRP